MNILQKTIYKVKNKNRGVSIDEIEQANIRRSIEWEAEEMNEDDVTKDVRALIEKHTK